MRVLFVQAAVFGVIFFLAGLVIARGDLPRTFLMTLVATVVYAGVMAVLRRFKGKKS